MVDLLDPTNVITRMFNGKNYDQLYNYCKDLLKKDPSDMLALQNISLSLIYLKNYEETLVYCDKVLEIKSSDTYALKNKIFCS
jgi:hypothetical protein